MKEANYASFFECIGDLMEDECVRRMQKVRQHAASVSTLGHSLFVAYLSYRLCRALRLNHVEAARGGLLHDLFLYDQHDLDNRVKHLFSHPAVALENAQQRFDLTDKEKDAIHSHMWPLTVRNRPHSREAAAVCLMDKVCTVAEVTRIYHICRMPEKLKFSEYRRTFAAAG